jgi:hypothetical protein
VFFVCPALNTINVDGLNEYLPTVRNDSLRLQNLRYA